MRNLKKLRDVLLTVGLPVFHYYADSNQTGAYIVWREESGGDAEHGDDIVGCYTVAGRIFLLTTTEFDENVDKIMKALNDANIAWALDGVEFDRETGYIQTAWRFEVAETVR